MKPNSAVMTGGRLIYELKASCAFLERNVHLVRRYIGWKFCFLIYAIVSTLSIGLIGKTMGDKATILYLVIGALMWNFLSSIFNEVAQTISWERWEGTLEYTFMAPVHRLTHLVGVTWFAVVYGLLRTFLILLAAAWFFGLDLRGANLGAAWSSLPRASRPCWDSGSWSRCCRS